MQPRCGTSVHEGGEVESMAVGQAQEIRGAGTKWRGQRYSRSEIGGRREQEWGRGYSILGLRSMCVAAGAARCMTCGSYVRMRLEARLEVSSLGRFLKYVRWIKIVILAKYSLSMPITFFPLQGLLGHAGDYTAHILHRRLPFGPRTLRSVMPPNEREQYNEQAISTWPRKYLPIPAAAKDRPAAFILMAPIRLKTRPPLPP